MKRSTIKSKPKDAKYIADRKAEGEKMMELFEEHWNLKKKWVIVNRYGGESIEHMCEGCGNVIWGENKTIYHDHLLMKSRYPEYKYDINNLFLCCWQCHSNKENGYPHPNHKKAIEAIKLKYNII